MKSVFFLLFFFLIGTVLISCSTTTNLASIDFDSCFLRHDGVNELQIALTEVTEVLESKVPEPAFMTVAGCLNYQLGNYTQSEEWLKRAFAESSDKEMKAKNLAASALSLIYLKEGQIKKIVPYMQAASEHKLGRWMLVLYHLDYYRETDRKDYLASAVKEMSKKQEFEGETSATRRFLSHMKQIADMEKHCGGDKELEQADFCVNGDLTGEKTLLFSTAYGFLATLLKEEPFTHLVAYQNF